MEQLCQNVELHHEFIEVDRIREGKQYSEASYHQELLIASLDALQKLCRQKIVVQQLLSTPALLTSIQRILDACRGRY